MTPDYIKRTLVYQQGVQDENQRLEKLFKSKLAQRNTLFIVNDGLLLALAIMKPEQPPITNRNIELERIISLLEARYKESLDMHIDSDFWRGVVSELEDILHLLRKELNAKDSSYRLHHSQLCAMQSDKEDDGQTGDSVFRGQSRGEPGQTC